LVSVSLKREQERDARKETGPLFIGLVILRMEEKSLTQDQKDLDIQRLSHLRTNDVFKCWELALTKMK